MLPIFVGDDWAEDHHDIHLMDTDGTKLASRRLPEGLGGVRQFHELVAAYADDPTQVVIGIETDRGLWVEALAAAGDLHHQALRALGNRLVGLLHGCLRHHTAYDEHKAWAHRQPAPDTQAA